MNRLRSISLLALVGSLVACAPAEVRLNSDRHVAPNASPAATRTGDIPSPVQQGFSLPPPKLQAAPETYSVVVNNVPVQDLLFALARDAKLNVDIHPGLNGSVTLNALDQTLPQLLTRISKQIDLRFELDGPNLVVMPDSPFLRTYKVDYVNLARDTTSTVSVASQLGSATGGSRAGGTGQTLGSGSSAIVQNTSNNRFWDSLVQNIKDILRETDKVFPDGARETIVERTNSASAASLANSAAALLSNAVLPAAGTRNTDTPSSTAVRTTSFREAASVIANIESGVITVRATSRQHEKIAEFVDRVINSAKRQVLIETTIAEVELSQNYQQGVEWSALNLFGTGFRVVQRAAGGISGPSSTLLEVGFNSSGGNFTSAIKLLEGFGTVKILSSPKMSVLNNQTAVMKVVDDNIYFTYEIEEREATTTAAERTRITSTLHSVPVGLVMTITPQVGDDETVTLNIRPSLSRVIGQKEDPSFQFVQNGAVVRNTIPIIRARELDSVMRVRNGNIAVMGGLMEDLLDNRDDTVPGLANVPFVGALFQNRNDTKRKTELVIFIRPTIVRDASLDGDYRNFRPQLPDEHFFQQSVGPKLPSLPEPRE